MFTGIVETTGKIKKIDGYNRTIEVGNFLDDIKIGDSIAINGVCTTVISLGKDEFTIELMPETLRVTNFNEIGEGGEVNLEKSLKMNGRLDGHFVLGHVDGVGRVLEIKEDGEFIEIIISALENLRKYLAKKGTVAVNGVSLTISEDLGESFKVSLITHTREVTNLKNIKKGDAVNLEIDMLARYIEKIIMSDNKQNK